MHSCLYLQVYMYRNGPKTDCSTVLGLFTSRSKEEVHVITTDVWVKGHMHRGQRKLIWLSTSWTWKTQNRTRQSNIIVNSTKSHLSHLPFLLLNTLKKEFSATDYCVTLYIYISSPWDPWVLSQYWDWKTWIWSQSSSRAIMVDSNFRLTTACQQSAYCWVYPKCFLSIWVCFYHPQ